MSGYQKLVIQGNLGKDPETRYTTGGQPVSNFSVAVSRRWKNKQGEQQEETEWFNVECWDRLAEIAEQYLSKGKPVLIEGRLRTRSWDDQKTGEKKYRTSVIASEMVMLGKKDEESTSDSGSFDAAFPF